MPAQDRTGPMYFDEIAGAAAARSAGEDGPGAAPREESAAGPAPEPGPGPGPGDRPAPGDPRRP
ncbi:hypothetical protein ADZ36_29310, partial [Streptomyces fradiae]